ncbi:MAG: NERD domain-containing protein [Alphaproteobacteria bacterium]|nr:NERD domain-containing protein [Alphaproteobacteria bacterium]
MEIVAIAIVLLFILFAFVLALRHSGESDDVPHNDYSWFTNHIHKNEQITSVTSLERGTWSERDLIYELLEHGIPAGAIFHDLYINKFGDKYTQIDLVVATKVGLIVFEVKDYKGWIFGRGNQDKWTQVLSYGDRKYRFYNPIKQNAGHISELRKQSKQLSKIPIFSVIVFYGGCVLRDISIVPHNTYVTTASRVLDVVDTIIEENQLANYTDKREIVRILKNAVDNGNNENIAGKHAKQVQDMLGKDRVFD